MATVPGVLFIKNTDLKQSSALAKDLPSYQKQLIPAGTLLIIDSYVPPSLANQNHYILKLRNIKFNGYSANWYAYADHVKIDNFPLKTLESATDVLAKQTEKNAVKIRVPSKLVFQESTIIKRVTEQAKFTKDEFQQSIPAGTELVLSTDKPDAKNMVQLSIKESHVKVSFKDIEFHGFNRDWYAYMKDVGFEPLG